MAGWQEDGRGGGGGEKKKQIFSLARRQSRENTLVVLMCIRSEAGKY